MHRLPPPRAQYLAVIGFLMASALAAAAFADDRGEGPLRPDQPKGITTQEIIQRFAAKEKEFEEARDDYTYRQSVKVQTLDGDTVDGEYQEVVDVLFDDQGKRVENVVFAPESTLQRITMTTEDYQDIRKLMPFVLTTDEIPEYNITYAGQQQEDELNTYVFDVNPKQIEKKKRRFQGRIWVDDHDFQIVKTYGKAVPDFSSGNGENLFPRFTTYREQIDGKYWFPTYTRADDELHFKIGDVHLREVVKYTNYKRFGAKHRILYGGAELPSQPQPPSSRPQPPQ
jgi:hypothetical protein